MNRPLRVLSLSTLFPSPARPGFGKFVESSLAAAARTGEVDLTIVNPIGLPPWPLSQREPYRSYAATPQSGTLESAAIHYPRFRLIPRFGDSNVPRIVSAVLPLVRQWHREQPFDLIDAQFFFPDGPVVAEIGRQLNVPWCIKARGADIHFWGKRPGPGALMLAAAREAAGLLAVSAALKDDMVALGMPQDRISVHYTGIDHARFNPLPRQQARTLISAIPALGVWVKGPLIVSTGALIERKGQRLVIEALRHLEEGHLLLVGSGPDEKALRELARRLDLQDRVQFLGQVSHDLLPQVLSAANVLALPSVSEGIANAWIEALACGTPLVIPDIGGAREVLRNSSAGRIAERTPRAIAAAIRDLLSNPPSQQDVAANAARYSWSANGAELVAYWQQITKR